MVNNNKPMKIGRISFGQTGNSSGWICPRCGQVNAYWVAKCDCKPKDKGNFDSGTGIYIGKRDPNERKTIQNE